MARDPTPLGTVPGGPTAVYFVERPARLRPPASPRQRSATRDGATRDAHRVRWHRSLPLERATATPDACPSAKSEDGWALGSLGLGEHDGLTGPSAGTSRTQAQRCPQPSSSDQRRPPLLHDHHGPPPLSTAGSAGDENFALSSGTVLLASCSDVPDITQVESLVHRNPPRSTATLILRQRCRTSWARSDPRRPSSAIEEISGEEVCCPPARNSWCGRRSPPRRRRSLHQDGYRGAAPEPCSTSAGSGLSMTTDAVGRAVANVFPANPGPAIIPVAVGLFRRGPDQRCNLLHPPGGRRRDPGARRQSPPCCTRSGLRRAVLVFAFEHREVVDVRSGLTVGRAWRIFILQAGAEVGARRS